MKISVMDFGREKAQVWNLVCKRSQNSSVNFLSKYEVVVLFMYEIAALVVISLSNWTYYQRLWVRFQLGYSFYLKAFHSNFCQLIHKKLNGEKRLIFAALKDLNSHRIGTKNSVIVNFWSTFFWLKSQLMPILGAFSLLCPWLRC